VFGTPKPYTLSFRERGGGNSLPAPVQLKQAEAARPLTRQRDVFVHRLAWVERGGAGHAAVACP
jgi:hypothetical protein